jgi:site-specific recombinase XerD
MLSPQSIQCYVRAIKAFFNWLYKEGYTKENRLERLKKPKAPKKLIDPLAEAEIAVLLSSIDAHTSWGARNTTIVLLMLDTGLRFTELLTLDMKDLHLEESYVKVMGKGQKERIVPFGSSAQNALMKYIYHFRADPTGGNQVFLNLDGSPMPQTGLKLMFQRLAESSGVRRLHTHLLRQTFAVNYLMNGGDVFTLQQILGHTTLEMVATT